LDLLDEKLLCECGKKVSARKSSAGDSFEPFPKATRAIQGAAPTSSKTRLR
jgi:hypothetical protein